MKTDKILIGFFLTLLLALGIMSSVVWAVEPYPLTLDDAEKYKGWLDDPAPFFVKTEWYKKIIPAEAYAKLTFDQEKMKKTWAEAVGFKAPDVVGKIAPEIKPGTYTVDDKNKYPFEKLMWKHMYDRFNPPGKGTPNHAGNFTKIEVVPTRQYYWALPIAEATLKNMGKTRLDNEGYLIDSSYVAGYPFPRPSGKFMAQQIVYNYLKTYFNGENWYYIEHLLGVNKHWKKDNEGVGIINSLRLHGRCVVPPYGWYDEKAKTQEEASSLRYEVLAPRDSYGNILSLNKYVNPDKLDLNMVYVNMLRRVRRMSASDVQDIGFGQDLIYDDASGFSQKLTPKRWPYTFKLIGEQEFLVPMTIDGSEYIDSKANFEYKNLKFERRPMWIVELNQLDPNYVYKKRILYIDKETLLAVHIENFDKKERLYRTTDLVWAAIPPMGQFTSFQSLFLDHIDVHSSWQSAYAYDGLWVNRTHIDFGSLIRAK